MFYAGHKNYPNINKHKKSYKNVIQKFILSMIGYVIVILKNVLIRFPCLFFWRMVGQKLTFKTWSTIRKNIKNRILKNIWEMIVNLGILGKVNIATQLSEDYKLSRIEHNEGVQRNRETLSKIISCIRFCGKFELSLHGHNRRLESAKPRIFQELEFTVKLEGR